MEKYYVSALIQVKDGYMDTVRQAIVNNIPNVRAEKGCLLYDLHQAKDGSNSLYFYEIWQDKASLDAHSVAPHMKAYRELVKDWLAAPTQVQLWSAVDVAHKS